MLIPSDFVVIANFALQVDIFWDPLSHKVFHEISSIVRVILSESGLSGSSQSKANVSSTCQVKHFKPLFNDPIS